MFPLLRNVWRRRVRTVLTIIGVAIGIMALTVLGSMAERLNALITSSMSLWAQHITVIPGREGPLAELILPIQAERIQSIEGVARVQPRIEFPYAGAESAVPGFVPQVIGVQPSNLATLPLQSGRTLQQGERGVVVVGADLAVRQGWRVGDEIEVQGSYFRLVGIVQPLLTVADQWIYIPLDDARQLLVDASPLLRNLAGQHQSSVAGTGVPVVDITQIATSLQVFWKDGTDPEQLTHAIQRALPELTALSPHTMEQVLNERLRLINALVLGSALIGLIVGGVSVVNTMVMAVTERRSEIALKRALGATTSAILREVVGESAWIGAMGGLLGVGMGTLLSAVLNRAGTLGYHDLFMVTPRLVLAALGFSVFLGAVSGLGPAFHAAGLNPVDGLREE